MLVTVSNRWRQRMASCWEHFAEGSGCTLLGCVVWFTVQLAATCLVMRRPVRRENAPSDLDLAGALYGMRWLRSVFASLPSPTGSARAAPTCV